VVFSPEIWIPTTTPLLPSHHIPGSDHVSVGRRHNGFTQRQGDSSGNHILTVETNNEHLPVAGFNPFEKYDRQIGSLSQVKVNIKNM